jgi:hypothetical protein
MLERDPLDAAVGKLAAIHGYNVLHPQQFQKSQQTYDSVLSKQGLRPLLHATAAC